MKIKPEDMLHFKPFTDRQRALCGRTEFIHFGGPKSGTRTNPTKTTEKRAEVNCPKCVKHLEEGTQHSHFTKMQNVGAVLTPTPEF
jgi:hypothetical protein